MHNTTSNSPVIGQVNTSSIVIFQDHGILNLQFHRFQDSVVIQHILCTLRTRGSLSLSRQQGCRSLQSTLHRDWTNIKKRGVSTHTATGFWIHVIVRIRPSTDGELKVIASIPLVIWPQGQSTIRCTNSVLHGAFYCLDISLSFSLNFF